MRVNCTKSCLPELMILMIVSMTVTTGCGNGGSIGTPAADSAPDDPSSPSGILLFQGEVLETMDAGGYTYVRATSVEGEIWAAGPLTAIAAGDVVNIPQGILMTGFHSKTLDRTFDEIHFVHIIEVVNGDGQAAVTATPHAGHTATTSVESVEAGSIEKADGGFTIAELYAGRDAIAGKEVLVRGKVVKFTPAIMGMNWVHIQDGSGEVGSNDLTITTQATAALGDIILVKGKAAVDKDFGAGYRYSLILEEATINGR